jgi:TPR repeat protein
MRLLLLFAVLVGFASPSWSGNTLEKACDTGDAIACNNWGYDLEHGHGVEQDKARARAVYERACDLGQAHSCSNVGLFLQDGRGGEADVTCALEYLRQGCKDGDPKGCTWVAKIHRDSEGYQDARSAAEYAQIGCNLRDASAKDVRRARQLYEQTCAQDSGLGCSNLSKMLRSGEGGPRDRGRATELNRRACDLGYARAC